MKKCGSPCILHRNCKQNVQNLSLISFESNLLLHYYFVFSDLLFALGQNCSKLFVPVSTSKFKNPSILESSMKCTSLRYSHTPMVNSVPLLFFEGKLNPIQLIKCNSVHLFIHSCEMEFHV